jgi:hypothetical protein
MNYFIEIKKGQRKTFEKIPNEAYIMGGYQNPLDAGKVYLMSFDEGTCLTPLFFVKDGSHVVIDNPAYYGKNYGEMGKDAKTSTFNYDTSATALCLFMAAQDEQKTSSPIHPIFEQVPLN